jgi:hypothetical protein
VQLEVKEKKSYDLIGTRTRDLSACNVVPQAVDGTLKFVFGSFLLLISAGKPVTPSENIREFSQSLHANSWTVSRLGHDHSFNTINCIH